MIIQSASKSKFSLISRCFSCFIRGSIALVVVFLSIALFIINLTSLFIFFNFHEWRYKGRQSKKQISLLANKISTSSLHEGNNSIISILIVTFNDSRCIGETLRNLESCTINKENTEIIILDLGSSDNTLDVAKASSCAIHIKFVKVNQQQYHNLLWRKQLSNDKQLLLGKESAFLLGSTHAQGDILLLLRPDALLQKGYDDAIRGAFKDENLAMASFRLNLFGKTTLKTLCLKLTQVLYMIRQEKYRFPHLLQGLSIRSTLFESTRFTDSFGLCEDLKCIHNIRSSSSHDRKCILTLPQSVSYPAQCWDQTHIFEYLLIDQIAFACHRYFCMSAETTAYICSIVSSRLKSVRI